MNEKTISLLKSLKYREAPQKSIRFKNRTNATPQLIRVEYFVDLVARGAIPDSSISYNVRNYHKLSQEYKDHTFYVPDLEEALTVLREFCTANGLEFGPEDEARIRQERNAGQGYLLFIFEHPIFAESYSTC